MEEQKQEESKRMDKINAEFSTLRHEWTESIKPEKNCLFLKIL